jgi:hypothetical protein
LLALTTVAVGVAAHLLGGGGATLRGLPLVAAVLAGVAATVLADRLVGYHRRVGAGAVGLVGGGQLLMHLLLSGALSEHPDPPAGLGPVLSCGVVLAHAGATGVLVAALLGTQRLLELPLSLISRARGWLRVTRWTVPVAADGRIAACVLAPATRAAASVVRIDPFGVSRSRRGPPAPAAR